MSLHRDHNQHNFDNRSFNDGAQILRNLSKQERHHMSFFSDKATLWKPEYNCAAAVWRCYRGRLPINFRGTCSRSQQLTRTRHLFFTLDLSDGCAKIPFLKTRTSPPGSLSENGGNSGKIFLVRVTIPSKYLFFRTTFYITLT